MSEVPITYSQKVGEMRLSRGSINGEIRLYAWDVVQDCTPDCRAKHYCGYEKTTETQTIKCQIQYDFVRSFVDTLFRNYKDKLDEPTMYQVGVHLIPMYRMLCKMLIDELGFSEVSFRSTMAGWKVYPIYKEIRDQIKSIQDTWRALGLQAPPVSKSLPPTPANPGIGTDYYGQMERGEIPTFSQQASSKKKSRLKR